MLCRTAVCSRLQRCLLASFCFSSCSCHLQNLAHEPHKNHAGVRSVVTLAVCPATLSAFPAIIPAIRPASYAAALVTSKSSVIRPSTRVRSAAICLSFFLLCRQAGLLNSKRLRLFENATGGKWGTLFFGGRKYGDYNLSSHGNCQFQKYLRM